MGFLATLFIIISSFDTSYLSFFILIVPPFPLLSIFNFQVAIHTFFICIESLMQLHHEYNKQSRKFPISLSSIRLFNLYFHCLSFYKQVKIELAVDGKAVQVPTVPNSQPQPIIPSTTTVSMVSRPVVISSSQPHQHSALSSKPPLPHTSRYRLN